MKKSYLNIKTIIGIVMIVVFLMSSLVRASMLGIDMDTDTYIYDGTSLTKISGMDPDKMIARGNNLMIYANGAIYEYDGSSLTWLSNMTPDIWVTAGSILYLYSAAPPNSCIYKYEGGAFTWISGMDPEKMIAYGKDLVIYDEGNAMYKYDGTSWSWISGLVPVQWKVRGYKYIDLYDSADIYEYDGNSWTWLSGLDPVTDGLREYGNKLAVYDGTNVYEYNGSEWSFATNMAPIVWEGRGGSFLDLYNGAYLYEYDGSSWSSITSMEPNLLVSWDYEQIAGNFVGDGVQTYDGLFWTWLSDYSADNIVAIGIDTDGDQLPDWQEIDLGYNPLSEDTDDDGMPDSWEHTYGLQVLVDDANGDLDGDGMLNLWEYENGFNPTLNDASEDPDNDGLINIDEQTVGTDPNTVSDNVVVVNPGSATCTNCFDTIPAAIQDANTIAGDTVYVVNGTYNGNQGNRNIDLSGKAITVRSVNGADVCIIDCQNSGVGFYVTSSEDENTVISGFTIKNGNATNGSGIYCLNSSPTITECMIIENTASSGGGGIYCEHSSPTITNCTITGNNVTGGRGGGIYINENSNLQIENCTINNNTSTSYGGGISIISGLTYSSTIALTNTEIVSNTSAHGGGIHSTMGSTFGNYGSLTLDSCKITENSATNPTAGNAGGLFCSYGSLSLTNCLVADNSAPFTGGGVTLGNSTASILNSTIANNTANNGSGIYSTSSSTTIKNSITWNQALYGSGYSLTYTCNSSGSSESGNTNQDPLYVYAANGNYRLRSTGSPCVDSADATDAPSIDIDGVNRPQGAGHDMGVYEMVDIDGDGLGDALEEIACTDKNVVDTDADGIDDGIEDANLNGVKDADETDPCDNDTDDDGLLDGIEAASCTDPLVNGDADNDGLSDITEDVNLNGVVDTGETDPCDADTDEDGMPDGWETTYGFDPTSDLDADEDLDSDGLTNLEEYNLGTLPNTNSDDLFVVNPGSAVCTDCYSSIQAAIDAVTEPYAGKIVYVTDDTYTGAGNYSINFNGKPISVQSVNGPDNCIVDANEDGPVFVFKSETNDSVLSGLTIKNGFGNTEDLGGGIQIETGASPTIENCIITENEALFSGGGIRCNAAGSAIITDCIIKNNTARWTRGGGLYFKDSGLSVITNCMIVDNSSGSAAGGVYSYNSSPTFMNCTIAGNTAANTGGGLQIGSGITITNSIVWGNSPDQIEGPTLITITYSCIGGYTGTGIIDVDPLFATDYHLHPSSPCRDAVTAGGAPDHDIDRDPRQDGNDDMGADEYADTDSNGLPDFWEIIHFGDTGQDPDGDLDLDNLINFYEFYLGTNPNDEDTDNDGALDGTEDANHNGVIDSDESDPFDPDTDDDGLLDGIEHASCTDPLTNSDADNDGLLDITEDVDLDGVVDTGETDPCDGDTDDDGMPDGWEIDNDLLPRVNDASDDYDNDGLSNIEEYELGTLANAANFVVKDDQSTPYPYIQDAVDSAASGDIVYLYDGTFTGTGNKNVDFQNKAIIIRSIGGPKTCIIDCQNDSRGFFFQSGEGLSSVLSGVTITGGNAYHGGGIYIMDSSPTIKDCIIIDNIANTDSNAGGIFLQNASPDIINCVISGNTAGTAGGGISCGNNASGSVPNIINCTIVNNTAPDGGGFCFKNSTPTITNSIIWGNSGEQISDISGNTITITFSNIQEGYAGTGNIDDDPMLYNAADNGYHLQPGSPCIDAGTTDGAPDTDVDGETRPADAGVDMGADEFTDTDTDNLPDYWEALYFPILGYGTNDDPDNDGITNVDEYTVHLNPNQLSDSVVVVNPGSATCTTCFDTIQDAIDHVDTTAGDSVYVVDGTYTGIGNREISFNGKAIVVTSVNGPDTCIIDCESSARGFVFDSGEGNDSVLSGFTITNGGNVTSGAGIQFANNSSPTIENCIITNNVATNSCGGISCNNSSPILNRCIISDNTSGAQGAGGLYFSNGSQAVLTNCLISNNTTDGGGGGIYVYEASTSIINCTITGNSSYGGGAIKCGSSGNTQIVNSILYNNSPNEIGGSVAPTVTYSLVQCGYDGTGNIDADPMFADAANGDFSLDQSGNGSPCLDAGTSVNAPEEDIDGEARPWGARIDIGADECMLTDADKDGMPDYWENRNSLNSSDDNDAQDDPDEDGLANHLEYDFNTDINNADTDGDGMSDLYETQHGLDPSVDDADDDLDADGISNYMEYKIGTDPNDITDVPAVGFYIEYDEAGRIMSIIEIE